MTSFRRLAVAATAATFLLVTIGGLVRATKSGLGCGSNWPHCPGAVDRALLIELSHRAVAGVIVVLLAALAVTGFRHRRELGRLTWLAIVAFGLVLFQAVLGAVVVWLELKAESVVLHLGTAMALLGLLVYLGLAGSAAAGRLEARIDPQRSRRLATASALVLLLLLLGSFVTGSNAGDAFADWPLMEGRVVPDLSGGDRLMHFVHRLVALVAGVVVFLVALRLARAAAATRLERRIGGGLIALFAAEVLVGAANVWSDLNAFWVTVHLALGAAIWALLVAATALCHPSLETARRAPLVTRSEPALEAS